MNKIVSHLIVGLVGGAIGSVASFFITRHVVKSKYDDLYHTRLDEAYESAKKNFEKTAEAVKEQTDSEGAKAPSLGNVSDEEKDDLQQEFNSARASFDERLNMIRNKYNAPIDDRGPRPIEQQDENFIVEIPEEAFYDDTHPQYKDDYEHIELTWYCKDDVMCHGETEEVINNIETIIGYGHLKFTNDICVLRNTKLKKDVHIMMQEAYYSEEVLGIDPAFRDDEDEE